MAKISLQLRLDENLHKELKLIADKELRSLNSQIEYFILKGVEEFKKSQSSHNQ